MAKKKAAENKKETSNPNMFVDGLIQMPVSMITTKEAFLKLWKGKRNARDRNLEEVWKKAEAFKKKNS
jgi:hypothetical protein